MPPEMPVTPAATDDLALALELADLADAITLGRFRAADLVVDTKPDMTPVSEADRDAERALRDRLAAARPRDIVFGEEYGGADLAGARRWILDPIDGTKSYVRGIPAWATLIALEQEGEMVLGVASAPALGRRWWARRGHGAWGTDPLGGTARPLRVSAIGELADAQVCYGGLAEFHASGTLGGLYELGGRCWRTRGYGDFWTYMLVAEGAMEIGLDPEVSLWDLAAPMVIVEEAGGRFTDFAGVATAAGGSAIASNGLLHETARSILSR